MNAGSFILKNALRNKRRALLSVLSVAVSLFLFVTLLVALREITVPPEDIGAALRVAVRSKISIANLLPARQFPLIERIPGVEAVTPFTWFGGKYQNEEAMTFAQFAMDPRKLRTVFGEAKMPEEQYVAFEQTKDGCIIGRVTAEKYNLKIGDRITLESTLYPCTPTFKIVGIYSGTIDDRNMLFRHDYLDDACGAQGYVGMWWLRVRSADDMPRVISQINRTFMNTSAEVRAESERAFQLSFISMWGNVKILIGSISAVVVFTLLLVSASTMSMAVRERFRELAILKAVGYRRRELFAFILAESCGLALAGLFVGVGSAWLLFTHGFYAGLVFLAVAAGIVMATITALVKLRLLTGFLGTFAALVIGSIGWWAIQHPDIAAMTNGIFITFEVTPRIIGQAALIAIALGILSSIAPSIAVARMSVVGGLKTLD